jgi:hypothetical protein
MCEPSSIGRESECGNQTGGLTTSHSNPTNNQQKFPLPPSLRSVGLPHSLRSLALKNKTTAPTHLKTPTKPNAQGDTTNKQHKPTTNTKHPTQTHTHPRGQPSLRGRQQKPRNRPNRHTSQTHSLHSLGGVARQIPGYEAGDNYLLELSSGDNPVDKPCGQVEVIHTPGDKPVDNFSLGEGC